MKTVLISIVLLGGQVLVAQQGWRLELSDANVVDRMAGNTEVFNGQIWIFNGNAGAGTTQATASAWSSSDGVSWNLVLYQLPWASNDDAASTVFGGKLWKSGGEGGNIYGSDVWSSDDGVNWTEETQPWPNWAPWAERGRHTMLGFNGRLWVMGGYALQPPYHVNFNDVWSSPDGVNWTQEIAVAPWSARGGHTSVVFDNRMWVIGGGPNKRDVWSSADGINWTLATDSPPWPPVAGHVSVVFRGRMWVIGGLTTGNTVLNQAWSSVDGVNWKLESSDAPWGRRAGHMSVVFNNRIWIMGGSGDWTSRPDIWSYGLHFTPDAFPAGIVEVPYSATIEAKEGDGPYAWSLVGGALPPGFTIDLSTSSATVPFSGVSAQVGKFTFTLRVEDQSTGDWAEQELSIEIKSQTSDAGRRGENSIFPGGACANRPNPQIPAAVLTAATAAALLRRRRQRGYPFGS
jgi:hypothetical protein